MKSYLLIYLNWVFLSPLFKRSNQTWKYDLNNSLSGIVINAGHKPLSLSTQSRSSDLLLIVPGFQDAFITNYTNSTVNITDLFKPDYQCNFTWVTGRGYRTCASGKWRDSDFYTHSSNPLHSYPFIIAFLERLSGFNRSFEDDLFINVSIHRIQIKQEI
jgi:hypothetical protein